MYLHRLLCEGEWDWNTEAGQPLMFDNLAVAQTITAQMLNGSELPEYYVDEGKKVDAVELYEVRKLEERKAN